MLSIIIPSYKRANLLFYGLGSLTSQKIKEEYEVIVLNDGVDDDTRIITNTFKNTKYIFTGQRNLDGKMKWRCPGFVINIGVKKAKGDILLLTCPEIYVITPGCINAMVEAVKKNPKTVAIPKGWDDRAGKFLEHLKTGGTWNMFNANTASIQSLHMEYPFCMAMQKDQFIRMGGYDEDFIGYCSDDTDFSRRLKEDNCVFEKLSQYEVIHLYHTRATREGLEDKKAQWDYNKQLYNDRIGIVVRNVGKEWGKLDG